jgi:hypothetical protein
MADMENVLLVSPTKAFVERLPFGKIPTMRDFLFFLERDEERISYWSRVVDESERLGDDFLEAVETGKIRELVTAMPEG